MGADFFERLSKVESTAQAIELAEHVIGKVTDYEDANANPIDGEQSQQGQSADSNEEQDCDCEGEGDDGAGGDNDDDRRRQAIL